MKPYRVLLLLIGSCVLSLVAWTSNAHALPVLTITDQLNRTATLGFTSVTSAVGCVPGYTCYRMNGFPTTGGTAASRSLSFVTTSSTPVASTTLGFVPANAWLQITTQGTFTSGPIVSESGNGATTAAIVINGGMFQGFSQTTGTLTITVSDGFNLTATSVALPLAEQGAFLQTSGSFTGDTLLTR